MYTDEDKVFCVKRMWAEGLTPTAASRLWGAPSRRTLAAWEKEALGGGLAVGAPRVPGACRRAKHARYPEETRAEALRLLGLGKPTREIARALGLPSGSVVSRWAAEARRRAKMAPEAIAMGKEKGAPGPREAELDRLRMECAVLREMLSDPKAGDPARLSNRQKAELGERLRRDYGFRLRRVTAFLRISKSSYEYERRALAAPRRDDGALAARVARAFASLGGMCGYRKVAACIRAGADGEPPAPAPERRVRRAMREGGMSARGRRAGGAPGHGRDGVLPQRVQGLPQPRHRLLGRLPGGVLGLGAPGRRAVLVVAPRGAGLPAGGLGARGPHGRRGLLQDGALEVRARGGGRVALDVAQGDVPGQREGGGLLRHAQAGVPLRPGVGGRRARGVRGAAVGVHGVVRRAAAQEVPRGGGRARYETLAEHRRRLGYPVPPFAAQQAQ